METLFCWLKITIFSDIIFGILPFRFPNHFSIVQEVIMTITNALFVQGFNVRKKALSDFCNMTLLVRSDFFPVSIAEDAMLTNALPLFIYYHGILYSNKHQDILKNNNNKKIRVFYYDYINSPFMLYQFYLETLSRIICNNIKKKFYQS